MMRNALNENCPISIRILCDKLETDLNSRSFPFIFNLLGIFSSIKIFRKRKMLDFFLRLFLVNRKTFISALLKISFFFVAEAC